MKTILLILCCLYSNLVCAQSTTQVGSETPGLPGYWQAFAGSGHYMINLGSIASVSKHEYVVDGVARVVEATIGANTAVTARFYYIEPVGVSNSPLSLPKETLSRLQQIAANSSAKGVIDPNMVRTTVVKNYPTTTHSHTVEWALPSEALINSLYNSLTRAIADRNTPVAWREN